MTTSYDPSLSLDAKTLFATTQLKNALKSHSAIETTRWIDRGGDVRIAFLMALKEGSSFEGLTDLYPLAPPTLTHWLELEKNQYHSWTLKAQVANHFSIDVMKAVYPAVEAVETQLWSWLGLFISYHQGGSNQTCIHFLMNKLHDAYGIHHADIKDSDSIDSLTPQKSSETLDPIEAPEDLQAQNEEQKSLAFIHALEQRLESHLTEPAALTVVPFSKDALAMRSAGTIWGDVLLKDLIPNFSDPEHNFNEMDFDPEISLLMRAAAILTPRDLGLLFSHFKPNLVNSEGKSPLIYAIESGHALRIKTCWPHSDLYWQDPQGNTLHHRAISPNGFLWSFMQEHLPPDLPRLNPLGENALLSLQHDGYSAFTLDRHSSNFSFLGFDHTDFMGSDYLMKELDHILTLHSPSHTAKRLQSLIPKILPYCDLTLQDAFGQSVLYKLEQNHLFQKEALLVKELLQQKGLSDAEIEKLQTPKTPEQVLLEHQDHLKIQPEDLDGQESYRRQAFLNWVLQGFQHHDQNRMKVTHKESIDFNALGLFQSDELLSRMVMEHQTELVDILLTTDLSKAILQPSTFLSKKVTASVGMTLCHSLGLHFSPHKEAHHLNWLRKLPPSHLQSSKWHYLVPLLRGYHQALDAHAGGIAHFDPTVYETHASFERVIKNWIDIQESLPSSKNLVLTPQALHNSSSLDEHAKPYAAPTEPLEASKPLDEERMDHWIQVMEALYIKDHSNHHLLKPETLNFIHSTRQWLMDQIQAEAPDFLSSPVTLQRLIDQERIHLIPEFFAEPTELGSKPLLPITVFDLYQCMKNIYEDAALVSFIHYALPFVTLDEQNAEGNTIYHLLLHDASYYRLTGSLLQFMLDQADPQHLLICNAMGESTLMKLLSTKDYRKLEDLFPLISKMLDPLQTTVFGDTALDQLEARVIQDDIDDPSILQILQQLRHMTKAAEEQELLHRITQPSSKETSEAQASSRPSRRISL